MTYGKRCLDPGFRRGGEKERPGWREEEVGVERRRGRGGERKGGVKGESWGKRKKLGWRKERPSGFAQVS
jgi:hypothetical protein